MTLQMRPTGIWHSQLIPPSLLAALCAYSGHVGHVRDSRGSERGYNKNGGYWCPRQKETVSRKKRAAK